MDDAPLWMRDPPPGWEWCPGEGATGERVDANWSRCPICRWTGFRSKRVLQPPRHQRPVIEQDTLF